MQKKLSSIKAIITVGVVVVALFTGVAISDNIRNWIPGLESKPLINVKTIQESVRELSELVALSYNYRNADTFSEQKMVTWFGTDFPLPFGKKSFIIAYDGEMKIGINMEQVSIDTVDGVIVIDMPSPLIISHEIKEDSICLLDEKSGWFNHISITDYTGFVTERKLTMVEKANTNGLLHQAQINAQKQIRTFILSLPGISREYEILFANND